MTDLIFCVFSHLSKSFKGCSERDPSSNILPDAVQINQFAETGGLFCNVWIYYSQQHIKLDHRHPEIGLEVIEIIPQLLYQTFFALVMLLGLDKPSIFFFFQEVTELQNHPHSLKTQFCLVLWIFAIHRNINASDSVCMVSAHNVLCFFGVFSDYWFKTRIQINK